MNEFQAAYDKAKRETPFVDETFKGRLLLQDHEVVVMRSVVRYCPYTDATLGYDIEVEVTFDTDEDAQEFIDLQPDNGGDVCYYTLRRTTSEELKSYNLVDGEEDMPF